MIDLNSEQREAVEVTEGPVLVLAGAGSGKTRVITCRVTHLIESGAARPHEIVAVTFTNKAAQEMKSRVEKRMLSRLESGARLSGFPLISTFHSLCVRILRRDIAKLKAGYDRNFTIYDEDDQMRMVKTIIKDLKLDERSLNARPALSTISRAKSDRLTPATYLAQGGFATETKQHIARVFEQYQHRLRQANALDFDDLLIKTVELLRDVREVRNYYHTRFRHVLIDEFQDTNAIQYELVRLIATGQTSHSGVGRVPIDMNWSGRSLCVVGDIDQSVYSWRGADFNIILGFQNDFAATMLIKLEQNYRSTQTILQAANRVIENNRSRLPKTLYSMPELGQGEKIGYYQAYDGEGEAAFIAERIQEHLRSSPDVNCAVLYRTNAQSRLFEEALRRRGLPYNIVGGFSFYERAEVKDLIAYLKLAINPNDDMALTRVINSPARGIGKATLDAISRLQQEGGFSLWEAVKKAINERLLPARTINALDGFVKLITSLADQAASEGSLYDTVRAAALETGYVAALKDQGTDESQARLLNIEELVSAAAEAEEQAESLRDFIDHAALVSDTDQYKADARVTLMTMHSAKGLEFGTVFIVGVEEGLFPHSRALENENELEEERRLCYVAITRAMKHLYITHAMTRRSFGEYGIADPSRFLNELPLELLDNLSVGPSWLGFALRTDTVNGEAAAALRGGSRNQVKKTTNYKGDRNNSVESVREFLRKRTLNNKAGAADRGDQAVDGKRTELRVGARVYHARYGNGVVLGSEGAGEDAKLTVSFPGFGKKKFVARYAALERVARAK